MMFEARPTKHAIDSLNEAMGDLNHRVSTDAVFLERLTLAADFEIAREFFSVNDIK